MHDPFSPNERFGLSQSIRDRNVTFRELISESDKLAGTNPLQAAHRLQDAAKLAWDAPVGLFTSDEIERRAFSLAARLGIPPTVRQPAAPDERPRVLHVMTQVYMAGGHSRLAWRWIKADSRRRHSVFVSAQAGAPVPKQLESAVESSGGRCEIPTADTDLAASARQLATMAADADFVVLHTHPHDVTPLLALRPTPDTPPVAVLNHASHVFWLGTAISRLCINLLEEGVRLSVRRRHLSPERCAYLPVPLDPPAQLPPRAHARHSLGLPMDGKVLFSSGSPYKFNPLAGVDFRDLVEEALKEYPASTLIVAGPNPSPYWEELQARIPGRIITLGYVDESQLNTCFAAADVYLDAAPFGSGTALLDAALCHTPVISFSPQPWRAAGLCFDQDNLPCETFSFSEIEHYRQHLRWVLAEPEAAAATALQLAGQIQQQHCGIGWSAQLEGIYRQLAEAAPAPAPAEYDRPCIEPIDIYLEAIARAQHAATAPAVDTPEPSDTDDLGRYAKAEAAQAQGDIPSALKMLRQLVRDGSPHWAVYNDLAALYFEAGLLHQALPLMQQAVKHQHDGLTARYNLAHMQLFAHDYSGALESCRQLVAVAPRDERTCELLENLLHTLRGSPWRGEIRRRSAAEIEALQVKYAQLQHHLESLTPQSTNPPLPELAP